MFEIHTNKRFMSRYERFERIIKDGSMVREFKACHRRYFYRYVLGYVPKDDNVVFAWGNAGHKFYEVLNREYGYGHNEPSPY